MTQSPRPHMWNPAKSNTETTVARLSRPRSPIGAATFVINDRSVVTGSEIGSGELFTSSSVNSKGHRPE